MEPRHLLTILALSPQASSLHDAVNYPVDGKVRGLAFSDSNIASNRYLYNGKELEDYTLGTAYLGTLDYGARHYDPRIARWTVPDPMAEDAYDLCAYSYCRNNPVLLVDPDGQFPETVWDVANIMLDIQSLIDNIKQRNIGASIVDGIGLAVDAAAALLPFIPGGAGTAIKGVRTAGKAADAVSDGFKVVDKASDIKNSIEKAESITEGSSRAARSPQGRRPSQERQLVTKKYPRFDRGWQ